MLAASRKVFQQHPQYDLQEYLFPTQSSTSNSLFADRISFRTPIMCRQAFYPETTDKVRINLVVLVSNTSSDVAISRAAILIFNL
jgi:hypothetical protein